jgi:hypothetical protein
MIDGIDLGEGDPGDFDNGAWHIACHLVAAGGVLRADDGRLLWLEVSHVGAADQYYATVTASVGTKPVTQPIASVEGQRLLQSALVLGFVEGNSVGRISARGINDSPSQFNQWRRQDFDHPAGSIQDGGRVWEHWCATRDIRSSCNVGTSVLSAYVCLVATLGDLMPALVARGRSDYAHPTQLCALAEAGFIREESALSDVRPIPLPHSAEQLLQQACPDSALEAAEALSWDEPPRYYMFQRRIGSWCPIDRIRDELGKHKSDFDGSS